MTDIQTVSIMGEYLHYTESFLLDNHGLASRISTKRIVRTINDIKPDVIHLHCIHGYYLNYKILFEFLRTTEIPIVWTFHDCWPFTGHCTYFDRVGCEKWKSGCYDCELKRTYPASILIDRSRRNYLLKKRLFTSVEQQTVIVPVSFWLEGLVKQSFFMNAKINTIHNGVDISLFKPRETEALRNKLGLGNKKVVLGVAMPWSARKGLHDMLRLAELLPQDEYRTILIGLDEKQRKDLPDYIMGLGRTNNAEELAVFYSLAVAFINPTYEDNFPTTNIEALACGTPVVTYKTGGSPEAIDEKTGRVVEKGDVDAICKSVFELERDIETIRKECRDRAVARFDKDKQFLDYLRLYNELTSP